MAIREQCYRAQGLHEFLPRRCQISLIISSSFQLHPSSLDQIDSILPDLLAIPVDDMADRRVILHRIGVLGHVLLQLGIEQSLTGFGPGTHEFILLFVVIVWDRNSDTVGLLDLLLRRRRSSFTGKDREIGMVVENTHDQGDKVLLREGGEVGAFLLGRGRCPGDFGRDGDGGDAGFLGGCLMVALGLAGAAVPGFVGIFDDVVGDHRVVAALVPSIIASVAEHDLVPIGRDHSGAELAQGLLGGADFGIDALLAVGIHRGWVVC
jgi:hypothetical protein